MTREGGIKAYRTSNIRNKFTGGRRSSGPEERGEEDKLMKMTGVTIRSKSSHQFPILPSPRKNDF